MQQCAHKNTELRKTIKLESAFAPFICVVCIHRQHVLCEHVFMKRLQQCFSTLGSEPHVGLSGIQMGLPKMSSNGF